MNDSIHGQSDRDELARVAGRTIDDGNYVNGGAGDEVAEVLWAAGWRKKPEQEAIARAIASGLDGWNDYDAASEDYKRELLEGADAVLALMGGPTETGESK